MRHRTSTTTVPAPITRRCQLIVLPVDWVLLASNMDRILSLLLRNILLWVHSTLVLHRRRGKIAIRFHLFHLASNQLVPFVRKLLFEFQFRHAALGLFELLFQPFLPLIALTKRNEQRFILN